MAEGQGKEQSQRPTNDDGSSALDILKDAQAPRSLQCPPPRLQSSSNDVDLAHLSAQDAADRLYRDSEILAPMVRASTTPLRSLALSHGATLTYTEELVDRSITSAERVLNEQLGTIDYRKPIHTYSKKVRKRMEGDVHNPDSRNGAMLLRIDPSVERGRLIYQIGTGEPNLALEAAARVIDDVDGLDVNMGCPKKFSVSGGMGSALLSDTKRACDIISTLRRNVSKPVTAKIRLLDPEDARPTLDFVRALINAGANAITIHGRIVGDESHTNARWGTLVDVVRELKSTESVPIIINGDLYTREDIREMKHRTGCDGVMLARPALYNISLFNRGDEEGKGDDTGKNNSNGEEDVSKFQTANHGGRYGYDSPLLAPRTQIVQEYIAHCVRYRAHSKNAKYVICEMMSTRRAPTSRVPYLNMDFDGGQTIDRMCKCMNLNDMVKLWDVNLSTVKGVPAMPDGVGGTCADVGDGPGSNDRDSHNYDDRYFLDHDNFRKERTNAMEAKLTAEKSGEGANDGKRINHEPSPKRAKV